MLAIGWLRGRWRSYSWAFCKPLLLPRTEGYSEKDHSHISEFEKTYRHFSLCFHLCPIQHMAVDSRWKKREKWWNITGSKREPADLPLAMLIRLCMYYRGYQNRWDPMTFILQSTDGKVQGSDFNFHICWISNFAELRVCMLKGYILTLCSSLRVWLKGGLRWVTPKLLLLHRHWSMSVKS